MFCQRLATDRRYCGSRDAVETLPRKNLQLGEPRRRRWPTAHASTPRIRRVQSLIGWLFLCVRRVADGL